jgi:hypothetical protein
MRELINLFRINNKRLFRNRIVIIIILIVSLILAVLFSKSGVFKPFEFRVSALCLLVSVCIIAFQMIMDRYTGFNSTLRSIISSDGIILTSRFLQILTLYLLELIIFGAAYLLIKQVGI